MSSSKEDLRVSIETMSDWFIRKQRSLSTFGPAQPNLRVNGQSFDERVEDDIEPFDEALDRHVWSLHDQRLGLHKTIATSRRTEPWKIEKTLLGSLEQNHKLDGLESEFNDSQENLTMDIDGIEDLQPEVEDALLQTTAWAQELSQSIPNQTERTAPNCATECTEIKITLEATIAVPSSPSIPMSLASRSALRLNNVAQRVPQLSRHLHFKNINGGLQSIVAPGHVHEGGHLPFSYRRKPAFFGKFAAFCTAGFTIPFAAVLYKRAPQV
ncbi:hypothetical protein LENED_009499 [Lentinula edodes]|uniref:Uncharacterized protein n=1 Tax=Lentinula edodes TaxID=5353 RepID=A0A1Q3EJY6_LENED|nr:hypothetical protein LENED_009499 [Lentinula edodes]